MLLIGRRVKVIEGIAPRLELVKEHGRVVNIGGDLGRGGVVTGWSFQMAVDGGQVITPETHHWRLFVDLDDDPTLGKLGIVHYYPTEIQIAGDDAVFTACQDTPDPSELIAALRAAKGV